MPNNTIVVVWICSSVLAFPISIGSMIGTPEPSFLRKAVRHLAFAIGIICIATTVAVFPLLAMAYKTANFTDFVGMAGFSILLWTAFHTGGALFGVTRYLDLDLRNAL